MMNKKVNLFYKLIKKIFPDFFKYPPSQLHDVLINKFLSGKSLVIAFPRGFGKSTYAWVFFPTWNVLTGKYRFIVFIASSKERAEEQFKTFRAELLTNPYLATAVEVVSAKADSIEYIDIVTKNRHFLKAYGAGQNLRGLRYFDVRPDLVILDDIESFEEIRSENYRKKLKSWFFADVLPLSETAQFLIIGTVMHEDSLCFNSL